MTTLITVPTAQIKQGELIEENDAEFPITAVYYEGGVELKQDGRGSIYISYKHLKCVCKEIQRHIPQLEKFYNKNLSNPTT